MDALRLIKTARHALSEARTVPDVLLEAWQASRLAEAVGSRIADRETGELGALGRLLGDAGSYAAECLDQPPDGPGGPDGVAGREGLASRGCPDDVGASGDRQPSDRAGSGSRAGAGGRAGASRADRLDDLGELEPVLHELGRLLHEVAETLVALACGADAEGLYWRCIDGVDSGAECKDLVAELLRTVRRASGATQAAAVPGDGCTGTDAADRRAGRPAAERVPRHPGGGPPDAGRAGGGQPGGGLPAGGTALERRSGSTARRGAAPTHHGADVPDLVLRLTPPPPTPCTSANDPWTGLGALALKGPSCQR